MEGRNRGRRSRPKCQAEITQRERKGHKKREMRNFYLFIIYNLLFAKILVLINFFYKTILLPPIGSGGKDIQPVEPAEYWLPLYELVDFFSASSS